MLTGDNEYGEMLPSSGEDALFVLREYCVGKETGGGKSSGELEFVEGARRRAEDRQSASP